MKSEIIQIAGPVAEPVTLSDLKLQCGLSPLEDTDHVKEQMVAQRLRRHLRGARVLCENYTRRALLTQTWLLKCDAWPEIEGRYHVGGAFYSSFLLPKPPFQSIAFMQYVDITGTVQTLAQSLDYGSNPSDPIYGYQLDASGDGAPARLLPPWAKPWPPTRRVANAVMLQFKCGYGGPVMCSTTAGSAILTGPVWNPGDVGQAISIPGAGASGAALVTTLASVDNSGQGTLAAAAATTVTNVSAWAGAQVPQPILDAILLIAQFMYDGNVMTGQMPPVVADLLGPYINRVS